MSEEENGQKNMTPLRDVDEIIVRQFCDTAEMARGTEEPNRYALLIPPNDAPLFKTLEDSSPCIANCCCSNRNFTLKLTDNSNRELIRIIRPHISLSCCCGLTDFHDGVKIYVRDFKTLKFEWILFGSVKSVWCPLFPILQVFDADGKHFYTIKGPAFGCGVADYWIKESLLASDSVGVIRKEWSGICREFTSEYDCFSIKFPQGIGEKLKACLIGALFLIDYKYY